MKQNKSPKSTLLASPPGRCCRRSGSQIRPAPRSLLPACRRWSEGSMLGIPYGPKKRLNFSKKSWKISIFNVFFGKPQLLVIKSATLLSPNNTCYLTCDKPRPYIPAREARKVSDHLMSCLILRLKDYDDEGGLWRESKWKKKKNYETKKKKPKINSITFIRDIEESITLIRDADDSVMLIRDADDSIRDADDSIMLIREVNERIIVEVSPTRCWGSRQRLKRGKCWSEGLREGSRPEFRGLGGGGWYWKFMKRKSPKSTLLADNTRGLTTTKHNMPRPVASAAPHPIGLMNESLRCLILETKKGVVCTLYTPPHEIAPLPLVLCTAAM